MMIVLFSLAKKENELVPNAVEKSQIDVFQYRRIKAHIFQL
jgi:hypothetical protein